jgi:hypothetical protein
MKNTKKVKNKKIGEEFGIRYDVKPSVSRLTYSANSFPWTSAI